ncbi:MAG: hotdog fold thioesterase [Streptosporangiaceae bacterium]
MTTDGAGRPRTLIAESGPERSFRVSRASTQASVAGTSMPAGPWLNGPDGTPVAGALGVLVDNALGSALMLMSGRPRDRWPVSAEISLDMCRPWPADATVLRAEARNVHSDTSGGVSSGAVRDEQGRLIALCRQHSRWAASMPTAAPAGQHHGERKVTAAASAAGPADLIAALIAPIKASGGAASLELTVTGELVNPLGNLHGGITLCACDLLAQAALRTLGGPSGTTSVHVAYTRPCPLGATVLFESSVAHCGRGLGVVQVTLANQDRKPCAIATVVTGALAQPATPAVPPPDAT